MKKLIIITILLLTALTIASEFGSALQQGVRQQGLAEAFTGLADDGEAVYYNQAGLVNLNGFEDIIMYSNQLGGLTQGADGLAANVSYLGHSQNLGEKYGSFGARWYYRGYSQGSLLSTSEHIIQLGYGHSLKQYIKNSANNPYLQELSAGIGLKIFKWGIYGIDGMNFYSGSQDYSVWNTGLELSAYYRFLDRYSLGLVVKDLAYYRSKEADKDYSEPVDFRFGGAWKYNPENMSDVIALDLAAENKRYSLNLGSERYFDLAYNNQTDRIIARGGMVIGFDNYYSLALGFGYQMNNLGNRLDLPLPVDVRIDYAFRMQTGEIDEAPHNNSFQLSFLFNGQTTKINTTPEIVPVEVIQVPEKSTQKNEQTEDKSVIENKDKTEPPKPVINENP